MAEEASPIVETPKKASKGPAKARKAKPVASHPKISVMVTAAIKELKERGGSSLQAIKKYIASSYKVDVERLAPFIKKYLKSAVASGELVQTKGKGASGSFKLKASVGKAEGKPKAAAKGPAKKAKPAALAVKKAAAKPAKRVPAKKVAKKPKAEKKSKPAKSPKKPKARAAAKPKPKAKKAKAPSKKASPKKAKK